MKKYHNRKSNIDVISGVVKAISEDRKLFTVATKEIKQDGSSNDLEFEVNSREPIDEHIKVGDNITTVTKVISDPVTFIDAVHAMSVAKYNNCFEYQDVAVISGDVRFASYNAEKDENGNPKMTKEYVTASGETKAPKAKTPHFDVSINVPEKTEDGGTQYVLHTVKVYETANNQKQIDRLKKTFKNFDAEKNGIYATLVTSPGNSFTRTNTKNDKEYVNHYCTHMGVSSMNFEFLNSKQKEKPSEEKSEKEHDTAKTETVKPNGLDAAPIINRDSDDDLYR